MKAYAVIKTGGKQYRVKPGDILDVERLKFDEGETTDISTVLALSDGASLKIGKPVVAGAKVKAIVLRHKRGVKLVSFKKKRRKSYDRKRGHRQSLTVLRIESLA